MDWLASAVRIVLRSHGKIFAPAALDSSHCVERQKLMVTRPEEMSVRVRKGGFVAN